MGPRQSSVGGGPATGLANDFVGFLQNALNTGTFGGAASAGQAAGANPIGATTGIAGILNDLLAGGAGQIGGNMNQMIAKDTDRQAQMLRERYTQGGGVGYGSPAANAEALLRSESGAKMTQATGQLQMAALMPILQMIMGLSGKGISQREDVLSPNPWMQGLSALAPLIGAAAGAFGGPPGMLAGAAAGSAAGAGTRVGNPNTNV